MHGLNLIDEKEYHYKIFVNCLLDKNHQKRVQPFRGLVTFFSVVPLMTSTNCPNQLVSVITAKHPSDEPKSASKDIFNLISKSTEAKYLQKKLIQLDYLIHYQESNRMDLPKKLNLIHL